MEALEKVGDEAYFLSTPSRLRTQSQKLFLIEVPDRKKETCQVWQVHFCNATEYILMNYCCL